MLVYIRLRYAIFFEIGATFSLSSMSGASLQRVKGNRTEKNDAKTKRNMN